MIAQYCQNYPLVGRIVSLFKKFLFEKFKVPTDLQDDVKKWTTFMRDSASEIPVPPVIVHLVRRYYSLDPPGTEGLSMETTESTVIDLRVPSSSSASKKGKLLVPPPINRRRTLKIQIFHLPPLKGKLLVLPPNERRRTLKIQNFQVPMLKYNQIGHRQIHAAAENMWSLSIVLFSKCPILGLFL
jgi:hypothetical protein